MEENRWGDVDYNEIDLNICKSIPENTMKSKKSVWMFGSRIKLGFTMVFFYGFIVFIETGNSLPEFPSCFHIEIIWSL